MEENNLDGMENVRDRTRTHMSERGRVASARYVGNNLALSVELKSGCYIDALYLDEKSSLDFINAMAAKGKKHTDVLVYFKPVNIGTSEKYASADFYKMLDTSVSMVAKIEPY